LDATELKQEFRVADWQVKPGLSELQRDDIVIQLEPRVMAVLQTLASRPGDVFSREELENTVWAGAVIGYDALAKAINKLREALGDDKKDPRYIQTISKKGYRLIAEVHTDIPEQTVAVTTSNAHKTPSVTGKQFRNRLWFLTGGVTAFFLLVGLILFFIPAKDQPTPLTPPIAVQENKPTIVVLPFRNISPEEKDDYLADGLTSDLTTNLSKLSGLWVTASHAASVYKNTDITPEKIKQAFKARYVISGEVNKVANMIRINVHLTDVQNGNILWAERYDRQFTDLFAILDEVTQKILNSLSLTLTQEEKRRLAFRFTHSLEAYDYFLRGQSLINIRTPEDNTTAREMYQKAIELDPRFGRAYAGVAITYATGFNRQWPSDVDNPLEKALELSHRAIELDKDLPESYWVAGFVYGNQRKSKEAIAWLKQALTLNPNYADAYAMLAWINIATGNPELALKNMSTAMHLNPTGGFLYDLQQGKALYFLGEYDPAITYLEKSREGNPIFVDTLYYLAAAYTSAGRYDEAGWIIDEAIVTNPNLNPQSWLQHHAMSYESFRAKLRADLQKAESRSLTKPR